MEAATKSLTSSGSFTGAWECLRGWWTRSSEERLREAEAALLRSAVSHSKLKITDVPIGCDGHTVHTLCVSQGARTGSGLAPVVLIHGYFMGSGSWAHSLDSLASTGRNVYSIDWPGWGLSSKLEFPLGQGTHNCEQYFIDGIERWRRSVGLERVVLLGHSFGGYFAACYAMKHPENVEALILASPVGMGEKRDDQGLLHPDRLNSLPWWQRTLITRARDMWAGGWTPMDVVRLLI
ncbi:abhd-5.1 [Symbiodinium pilosum]|uniref:Abhd-5.1 protein n=1 Tax=Symbiodinium pilosum TaxID=2952 RepID=A0A812VKR1_SYMPI|nr:abhd-5.1 [Symbiodinium pilosum]